MLQAGTKKSLLKTMPHNRILELRPELQEQNEVGDDTDHQQDTVDDTELSTEGNNGTDADEMEASTTFHDLEAEPTGEKYGIVDRVKRFMFRKRVNVANNAGQVKSNNNPDDRGTEQDNADHNARSNDETDPGEIEANTTFHDIEECTGVK